MPVWRLDLLGALQLPAAHGQVAGVLRGLLGQLLGPGLQRDARVVQERAVLSPATRYRRSLWLLTTTVPSLAR